MNSINKKEVKKSYITTKKLIDSLKVLGIDDLPVDKVGRWSHKGILSSPLESRPPGRPPGGRIDKGRGRPERLWPTETVEQAAGVWAMQHASRALLGHQLSVPRLQKLCIIGDEIHAHGHFVHSYPDLTKLISHHSPLMNLRLRQAAVTIPLPIESVRVTLADDYATHRLYTIYLCAKEKARHAMHEATRGTFTITDQVRAYLYYTTQTYNVIFRPGDPPEPMWQMEFSHSRLEASREEDDVVFFFDGMDARTIPGIINLRVGGVDYTTKF